MNIKYAVCVLEAIGSGLKLSNEKDKESACIVAIQALGKQIPKKINSSCVDEKIICGYCPNCNGTVRIEDTFLTRAKGQCCTWCGQKLEW